MNGIWHFLPHYLTDYEAFLCGNGNLKRYEQLE